MRRVAVVTGASRGIGRAAALELAARGCDVVLGYHTAREAAAAVAARAAAGGARTALVGGDLAEPSTADRLIEAATVALGGLDVLVVNAGWCPFTPFLEVSLEEWDRVLAVNLRSAFLLVQQAARAMIAAGRGGRIVCVASVSGLVGGARLSHYGASKAGLLSLVRSTAAAVGSHGITCNAVLPGVIETELNAADLARVGARQAFLEATAVKRLGRPEDVAAAIAFLASPEAGYVTGAGLVVDGGIAFTSE